MITENNFALSIFTGFHLLPLVSVQTELFTEGLGGCALQSR